MRIKRYRGNSVRGLLQRIKRDLGSNVQVLETRNVRRGGLLGLLRPRQVEIAVAFEEERDADRASSTLPAAGESLATGQGSTGDSANEYADALDGAGRASSPHGYDASEGVRTSAPVVDEERVEGGSRCAQLLRERGVPGDTAQVLAGRLNNGRHLDDFAWMRSMPISPPDEERTRIVALVGPTGGGKTTTCAKLAARMSLSRGYRVGLITSDTYRIGAVEQLRKYSRILNSQFEVVFKPEEMSGALRRLAGTDIVFIDTAGHNPRDEQQRQRLASFLQTAQPDEIHLVLDSGVDADDGRDVLDKYRGIGFNRLLLTKLDETGRPGRAIALADAAGVPLSYICYGQEVPDDVGLASEILSETLLEGMV